MNIFNFSESLINRLTSTTDHSVDALLRSSVMYNDVRRVLAELKHFLSTYQFSDQNEEIKFFKETKPIFLSQYYFHKQLFKILLATSFRTHDDRTTIFINKLRSLEKYSEKHIEFYRYCKSGAADLDLHYFTRQPRVPRTVKKDETFSTGYDDKLGKILAHEMLKEYLLDALTTTSTDQIPELIWTSSKVQLVELIYALHSAGVFNQGKTELKTIVVFFEKGLSIDLGNYARTFSEIQLRKTGRTSFLDNLKVKLETRMDRMI